MMVRFLIVPLAIAALSGCTTVEPMAGKSEGWNATYVACVQNRNVYNVGPALIGHFYGTKQCAQEADAQQAKQDARDKADSEAAARERAAAFHTCLLPSVEKMEKEDLPLYMGLQADGPTIYRIYTVMAMNMQTPPQVVCWLKVTFSPPLGTWPAAVTGIYTIRPLQNGYVRTYWGDHIPRAVSALR